MVMTFIYMNCGEDAKAMDDVEQLLSLGIGFINPNTLQMIPCFKSLHDNERFKALMKKYAVRPAA